MDLKILLEYQSLDRELFNKEKEFRECAEVEQFLSLQLKLKDLFAVITKADKESEEIFQNFQKKRELTESFIEQNGRIMQSYDNEGNLDKLSSIEEELTRLDRSLQTTDRDLSLMIRRLGSILESYNKNFAYAIEVNKKLKDADIKKNEKRAELLKSAEPIQLQLKNVKDQIPQEMFTQYGEIRKRKIMPALVEYYIANGSCGGCGMEVKHEVENLFKDGLAECPNCGRLLYKK